MSKRGLADIPARWNEEKEDESDLGLGLLDAADALAEFIRECETPLTIGLQGDWGSGKTSLMNFIQAKLAKHKTKGRKARYPAIEFNTWAYSQFNRENALPFSLMANLTSQLRARVKEETTRDTKEFRRRLKSFGTMLFAASSTATAVYTGGAVDLARIKGAVERAFGDEEDMVDEAQLFAQLRNGFAQLVEEFCEVTEASTVVIYVDDLDRLKPVRAIEILEVMKNFMDVERCVFVLAIDYDVVMQGLTERKGYELTDGAGKSFFDKIIQVPFRMPTGVYKITGYLRKRLPSGVQTGKFNQMWTDARLDHLIRHSIGTNPRSIKRLVNLFTLQTKLAKRMKDGKGKLKGEHNRILLPLCALQMSFHPVYQHLVAAATDIDLALAALSLLDSLDDPDSEDRLSNWSEVLAEDPQWSKALGDRDRSEFEPWIDKATRLRRRLAGKRYSYTHKQFADVEVLCALTFAAIDTSGDGHIDDGEKEFLSQLFNVVNLVGVDEDAGGSAKLSVPTLGAHSKTAAERGVGTSYSKLIEGLGAVGLRPTSNKASVGLYPPPDGRQGRMPTLVRVFPGRSGEASGVFCEVELQRLAEFVGCDAGEFKDILARRDDELGRWDPGAQRFQFGLLESDVDGFTGWLRERCGPRPASTTPERAVNPNLDYPQIPETNG